LKDEPATTEASFDSSDRGHPCIARGKRPTLRPGSYEETLLDESLLNDAERRYATLSEPSGCCAISSFVLKTPFLLVTFLWAHKKKSPGRFIYRKLVIWNWPFSGAGDHKTR